MKNNKLKKVLGYIALAMVCVMAGAAIATCWPAATAEPETQTVIVTSPFTEAISKVRDSVVGVNNYQIVSNYGGYGYGYGYGYGPYGYGNGGYGNGGYGNGGYGNGGYGNGGYGNGTQPNSGREVKYGSGSGVVIAKEYVLTNYHVIEGASSLKISLDDEDGVLYDAKVAAYDEAKDVAVLYVAGLELEPVVIGDSDTLQVGDWVVNIGNAIGFTKTATAGIVSALNREIESDTTTTDRYGRRSTVVNTMIQTDAAINSGNSGGGMFNTAGELVGIPTLKYSGTRYSGASIESIGMCIPINEAKPVIEQALSGNWNSSGDSSEARTQQGNEESTQNGRLGKPRLGVTVVTLQKAANAGIALPDGAYIYAVEENSPAQKAGLKAGDIIVQINDKIITSSTDMVAALEGTRNGDVVTVTIWRPATVRDATNYDIDTSKGEYIENIQVTLATLEEGGENT